MATYTKAVSETASSPSDAVTRTPGPSTSVVSFAAAATPLDICSDGVGGIWLTCYSGTGVLTFRATDGVLLNTYQWTYMYGLCSGNGYVWSTNHSNGNLYRFTPGTYALSTTSPSGYHVDYYPNYDPVSKSVWCSQMGAPANHLQVSASTMTVLSSYNAGSGSYYSGASDGTNWWIPCANETHITVLACNGGTLVNNLTAPHSYPYCCVFDGRYMWVSYSGNGYLTKYDPTTFAVVADYLTISSGGGYICLDNQKNIWLNGLNTVLQYSGQTGKLLRSVSISTAVNGGRLCYDAGTNSIWVPGASNTIIKISWTDYGPAIAETFGGAPSDALARAVAMHESVAESITVPSDATTRAVTIGRAVSDSVPTPTDALARAVALARVVTDGISNPADAVAWADSFFRSMAESVTSPSDTIYRAAKFLKSIAEILPSPADSITRSEALTRTLSEILPIPIDTVALKQVLARSIFEVLGPHADVVSRRVEIVRLVTELLTDPNDTVAEQRHNERTISESVTMPADTIARSGSLFRSISEAIVSPLDIVQRGAGTWIRSILESFPSPFDTITRLLRTKQLRGAKGKTVAIMRAIGRTISLKKRWPR